MEAGMVTAEVILALRTWAVWRRDSGIGCGLIILAVGLFIPTCIFTSHFLRNLKFDPPLYVGFRGCLFRIKGVRAEFVGVFAIGIVEIVVLGLMMISAFRLYRSGDRNELLNIIHRDGILFYVYLLCVTLPSVALMFTQPPDSKFTLVPLLSVLYSVFSTRIIINIRYFGRQGTGESIPELHHGYHETESTGLPMTFLPGCAPKSESNTVWTQTTERHEISGGNFLTETA